MNRTSELEVVYTPRSDLAEPGRFLREMFRDLASSRELAWRLFVRDMSARYRQSFLGYVWALLPPLATTGTFIFLKSQGIFSIGETAVPYPAYVMIGMLLWQVFADAVHCPLKAVTAAKPMLSKVHFPPEAVVMAGLGEVLFSFLIRLVLLVAVFVWYGFTPPATVMLLPVAVVALVLVGSTIGVLVTPLGVLYQDVSQALPIITTYWLFLTPVAYPAQEAGMLGWLSRWNPLSPVITVGRDWLISGTTMNLPAFVLVSSFALAMLFAGWVCYRIAMPHLIARIGN